MTKFQWSKWLTTGSALALSIALVACGEPISETDAKIQASTTASGWQLSPTGDLNDFFDCLKGEGATLVSAHRGGPYPSFPENAVESMDALLTHVPAIMEIDVATSSDGVLYLMHDDLLDRTTTGSGNTNDLPWSKIKSLKLEDNEGRKTGFSPSRFDDTLAWAKGRTIVQVDFKQTTKYQDVTNEIIHQDAEDRVILIAYSIGSAAKLHRLLPRAMISIALDSQSALNRAVAAGIPDYKILGFTGTQDPRPRLFSILNGRDVEVIFGTLGGRNSIDKTIAQSGYGTLYAEIAAQGADIIATDRPVEAHTALAQAGRAVKAGTCGITGP